MISKSFYFQHDYNAANDYKVLFLRQQLGIEGYGIYWYILEQLAQSDGKLPFKIIPVLAMQIQTTPDKVSSVIRNYDLFVIEDEHFFSLRLMKQIEFRTQLKIEGKKGADARWKNRQITAENSPPISPPTGDPNAKGKERKGDKGNKGNSVARSAPPKPIEERLKDFKLSLVPFLGTYGQDMVRDFCEYWTEKNPNGKKMRFEMERTFEISKRLVTWKRNEHKFKKQVLVAVNPGKLQ